MMFVKNEYFFKYLNLIYNNLKTQKGETESHHAIPVSFFKLKYHCKNRNEALKYANKNNILVNLSYYNHCLAHYLLCFCVTKKYKYQTLNAFFLMTKKLSNENLFDGYSLLRKQYIEFLKIKSLGKNNNNYGHKMSQEQRKQQSKIIKQYYLDHPEFKEKIREMAKKRTKEKNPFYGKHHNQKTIDIIRKKDIANGGKKVKCLNDGNIYISARDAERRTKIDHSSIIKCCKGKIKQINGTMWIYA